MSLLPLRCDFAINANRHFYQLGGNARIIREGAKKGIFVGATSHEGVRLTAMRVTVNEISSHLCNILTQIMVRTYLETGQRLRRITRRPVVTCYNSAKPPETSKCVHKRPKTHSFSGGRASITCFK